MTIKELKKIISNLPENTVVLIESKETAEVETVSVQFHSDGRKHLIFSTVE